MRYLFILLLSACVAEVTIRHPIEVNITSSTLSYKKDILPIINNRCALCHNAGMPELNWLNYQIAYDKRDNIKLRLENRTMPIGVTMPEAERTLMIEWVKQGAKP